MICFQDSEELNLRNKLREEASATVKIGEGDDGVKEEALMWEKELG